MNMQIIISFAIGGAMLISILALNNQVMQNSSKSTMDLILKSRLRDASELISNDFKNIGNYYGTEEKVTSFEDDRIVFWGDVYDDSTGTWNMTNTRVTYSANPADLVTSSVNPNDYYLTRTIERFAGGAVVETHTSKMVVSHFELKYLNNSGNPANYAPEIKSIEVELICQNMEPVSYDYNNEPIYVQSLWKKRFFPENMQRLDE